MTEPRITKIEGAEWGEFPELGETLSDAFALVTDPEQQQEAWFDAYFPFFWSVGEDASDGVNGAAVTNPLEFRVYLEDMNTNPAVIRHYALDEILREDIASAVGPDGKYADADSREWAERTAAALEAMAREIRAAL